MGRGSRILNFTDIRQCVENLLANRVLIENDSLDEASEVVQIVALHPCHELIRGLGLYSFHAVDYLLLVEDKDQRWYTQACQRVDPEV